MTGNNQVDKFRIIAHRGLLNGPDKSKENRAKTILSVLNYTEYDVELDVQKVEKTGELHIGHDYTISILDLNSIDLPLMDRIWFHAKNKESFFKLLDTGYRTFMHDVDPCALTSDGYVWNFPNDIIAEPRYKKSILMPDHYTIKENIVDGPSWNAVSMEQDDLYKSKYIQQRFAGICTKYPRMWSERLS